MIILIYWCRWSVKYFIYATNWSDYRWKWKESTYLVRVFWIKMATTTEYARSLAVSDKTLSQLWTSVGWFSCRKFVLYFTKWRLKITIVEKHLSSSSIFDISLNDPSSDGHQPFTSSKRRRTKGLSIDDVMLGMGRGGGVMWDVKLRDVMSGFYQ